MPRTRFHVHSPGPLWHALTWAELWPSVRSAAWVTALFVAAVWLAREYATPIQDLLSANVRLGLLVFFASSALAVLIPVLTNLPLVPLAVLAWGPWWTAGLLLGCPRSANGPSSVARYARSAHTRCGCCIALQARRPADSALFSSVE